MILSALSILTMPITEHFWTWDRFLETGRDFELSTLMVLMFLCLVLVLLKQRKQRVESFLSLCQILAFRFTKDVAPAMCAQVQPTVVELQTVPNTGDGFPLQI